MVFDAVEFFLTASTANERANEGPPDDRSRMANFALAVADRYGKDSRNFESFMWRWKAWSEYMLTGELAREFFAVCQDGDRLAKCSLEVAASLPLTKDGKFERQTFLASVADKLSSS